MAQQDSYGFDAGALLTAYNGGIVETTNGGDTVFKNGASQGTSYRDPTDYNAPDDGLAECIIQEQGTGGGDRIAIGIRLGVNTGYLFFVQANGSTSQPSALVKLTASGWSTIQSLPNVVVSTDDKIGIKVTGQDAAIAIECYINDVQHGTTFNPGPSDRINSGQHGVGGQFQDNGNTFGDTLTFDDLAGGPVPTTVNGTNTIPAGKQDAAVVGTDLDTATSSTYGNLDLTSGYNATSPTNATQDFFPLPTADNPVTRNAFGANDYTLSDGVDNNSVSVTESVPTGYSASILYTAVPTDPNRQLGADLSFTVAIGDQLTIQNTTKEDPTLTVTLTDTTGFFEITGANYDSSKVYSFDVIIHRASNDETHLIEYQVRNDQILSSITPKTNLPRRNMMPSPWWMREFYKKRKLRGRK